MKSNSLLEKNSEFASIIEDIITNDTVLQMKKYRQHANTNCFNHCLNVSYYCYIMCKKLGLDYISCARAAMLHDLFLYDWRTRQDGRKGFHAFTHPKVALNNASELFNLNEKEKDIILKHMWPVTVSLPKYRESFIITLADKYCALTETSDAIFSASKNKKIYRYAYIFFSLLILINV